MYFFGMIVQCYSKRYYRGYAWIIILNKLVYDLNHISLQIRKKPGILSLGSFVWYFRYNLIFKI